MARREQPKARVTFADSALPYSDAERRADAASDDRRVTHAKAVLATLRSGQRYDLPFDPAAHRRLQRKLGERD